MTDDAIHNPLPRDYEPDFSNSLRAPAVDEHSSQAATALFSPPDEEGQRDLDVPAFMRRLKILDPV